MYFHHCMNFHSNPFSCQCLFGLCPGFWLQIVLLRTSSRVLYFPGHVWESFLGEFRGGGLLGRGHEHCQLCWPFANCFTRWLSQFVCPLAPCVILRGGLRHCDCFDYTLSEGLRDAFGWLQAIELSLCLLPTQVSQMGRE